MDKTAKAFVICAFATLLTATSAQADSLERRSAKPSEQDRIRNEINRRRDAEEAAKQRAKEQKEATQRARMKQFGNCFYDSKGWKKTAADIRVTGFTCRKI